MTILLSDLSQEKGCTKSLELIHRGASLQVYRYTIHICIVQNRTSSYLSTYCIHSIFGGDFNLAVLALITKFNVCQHYL